MDIKTLLSIYNYMVYIYFLFSYKKLPLTISLNTHIYCFQKKVLVFYLFISLQPQQLSLQHYSKVIQAQCDVWLIKK